ncbi:protein SRC2 [Malania oleifera]|uniref:protein SRC2 n=1 Tax=Malania oleifera TaxID=397392 RepID=UPI0025AE0C1F|nr:protein SRC2 [Malania oleifera]
MEHRSLQINVMNAKDIKDVNLLTKMDVYVVVSISGDYTTHKQTTPVDKDAGTNPKWNHSLNFSVDDAAAHQNRSTLVFLLRSDRIFGDRDIGEVRVPVKELINNPGNDYKNSRVVSYQVRTPSGRAKGTLTFSYKLGDKIQAPVPAPYPKKMGESLPAYPAYPPPGSAMEAQAYPPPVGAHPAYPHPAMAAETPTPATKKVEEPVTAYPAPAGVKMAYPPPGGYYAPPPPSGAAPPYGAPPPAYPPQGPVGYYQPAYGYPPQQMGAAGYGYAGAQQQQPRKKKGGKGKLGLGLGAGLLGGLLIGDMMSDASEMGAYDAGYDAGFDDGGFDF